MVRLYQNWPLALFDRFHVVSGRPVVYVLRNGLKFSVQARGHDVRVINEIWLDKIYTSSPGFSIRDDWVIADVGGHKGIFSILAATSAPGVSVYTFEPSPINFAALSRNIELNGLAEVSAFNVAVGSRDERATLYIAAEDGWNSLIRRADVALLGEVPVEVWSMERVLCTIGSPVNLLKMDIEGMEYEVLRSCPPEYLQQVERIALEYHDGVSGDDHPVLGLAEYLRGLGFSTRLHPARPILLARRTTLECSQHDKPQPRSTFRGNEPIGSGKMACSADDKRGDRV